MSPSQSLSKNMYNQALSLYRLTNTLTNKLLIKTNKAMQNLIYKFMYIRTLSLCKTLLNCLCRTL